VTITGVMALRDVASGVDGIAAAPEGIFGGSSVSITPKLIWNASASAPIGLYAVRATSSILSSTRSFTAIANSRWRWPARRKRDIRRNNRYRRSTVRHADGPLVCLLIGEFWK
jgi:hypothetical protein